MIKDICVVKLVTESFIRGDIYFHGKVLRVMKRLTTYDLLGDTVNSCISIIKVNDVPDGLYKLVACNLSRDWESGMIDDWDLKLVPYNG